MVHIKRKFRTFKARERGEKDKFTTVKGRTKAEAALRFTEFEGDNRKRRTGLTSTRR